MELLVGDTKAVVNAVDGSTVDALVVIVVLLLEPALNTTGVFNWNCAVYGQHVWLPTPWLPRQQYSVRATLHAHTYALSDDVAVQT